MRCAVHNSHCVACRREHRCHGKYRNAFALPKSSFPFPGRALLTTCPSCPQFPSELSFNNPAVTVSPSASFPSTSVSVSGGVTSVTISNNAQVAAGTAISVTVSAATNPSTAGTLGFFAIVGSNGDEVSATANSGSRPSPLTIVAGKQSIARFARPSEHPN